MRVEKKYLQPLFILSFVFGLGMSSSLASFETRATIHTCEGDMHFVLLPNVAPITVMNFMQLSQDQFYNGTKFHRVARNFMIQGGDPLSRDNSQNTGVGGLAYCVPAEFSDRKHVRGTLSMARRPNNPDSAGSQFFICLGSTPEYDGSYTVFGQLVEGFDVLDKIGNGEVTYSAMGERTQPLKPISINSVSVIPLVPPQSPLVNPDWIVKAPIPDSSFNQAPQVAVQEPLNNAKVPQTAKGEEISSKSNQEKAQLANSTSNSTQSDTFSKNGALEPVRAGDSAQPKAEKKESATAPSLSAATAQTPSSKSPTSGETSAPNSPIPSDKQSSSPASTPIGGVDQNRSPAQKPENRSTGGSTAAQ